MENAVEGLKLAFAVLLLTMALSLTIAFFSKARTTAEMVLRSSDKTVYYDYTSYSIPQDTSGNRIVGYETIIPTLYKYDKERYKVTFKQGNYNETTGELSNVTNLSIYETKSVQANWNKNYVNDFDGETTSTSGHNMNICSFDIVEETQRNEPWVGSSEQVKLHLDAIFSGGNYVLPQNPSKHLSYSRNQLSNRNNKFIEQIGEIKTTNTNEEDSTKSVTGNKTTTKRIITYILIRN